MHRGIDCGKRGDKIRRFELGYKVASHIDLALFHSPGFFLPKELRLQLCQRVSNKGTSYFSLNVSLSAVVKQGSTDLDSRCGVGKVVEEGLLVIDTWRGRCVSSCAINN